jgi:hypothetical protein
VRPTEKCRLARARAALSALKTDFPVALRYVTQEMSPAKIDPAAGLQF